MTKLNYLLVVIVAFIFLYLLLSLVGVVFISITEILSYCMITLGIFLVYFESIRKNIVLIFLGSVLFLLGIYFLVVEQFNLHTSGEVTIPLILILCGTGLLNVYIVMLEKKLILIFSVVLLTAGLTLISLQSHLGLGSFLISILSVLNYLWPVFILAVLIILLIKK